MDTCKMQRHILLLFTCLVCHSTAAKFPDWLVTDITTPTTLTKSPEGNLILSNGLISREFTTTPDFTSVDFYSHEKQSSILRAIYPESIIGLDGIQYQVGGLLTKMPRAYMNRTALKQNITYDPQAFHYVSYKTGSPEAPFPYRPLRGAPKDIVWPPKGLRLDVTFKAPYTAPEYHQMVTITVHYEMYDGIPLLAKWISASALPEAANQVSIAVYSVEILAVNQQWAQQGYNWLFVESNEPHGTEVVWGTDPAAGAMPGSFEPIVNCSYQLTPGVPIADGFSSFHVHELVIGSADPERQALSKHRLLRLLAPQTQENPIFFHLTKADSISMRAAVDQLAEVGFEMLIYSFWSGFNLESTNETYMQNMAADIQYARSKGIEVGGYDLIALTRGVTGYWMATQPGTNRSIGSACMASGWYDDLTKKVTNFIQKTGMTMLETDGPYGGYACGSTNHSHHTGYTDSIYQQNKLQGQFYKVMRQKEIYVNQPDYYFYQGGSKTGMGYNENQYSLPRWQDISVSRQGMYDDLYRWIPTVGWMFVPLVQYHGGGAPAVFEPLKMHKLEYEWALAQYMGAGVAACYRGYRVFDCDETKAIVQKWVSFYKKYRDIITSDVVHVRRPDMQSIDSYMHVNPRLTNKGLAMVFNPTEKHIVTNLTLPLYYTGLTTTASISEQGSLAQQYTLERDYSVEVAIDLKPYNITWFLIK